MKTADEILKMMVTVNGRYTPEVVKHALNYARIEALTEACKVVKTYKVGNSGSWYDAAVDKNPIIKMIEKLS